MSKYYTSAIAYGNQILYRGISNGQQVKRRIPYKPTLYLPSKKQTNWKTLHGEPVEPMQFEGIREARDFVKRYSEVDNFKIYGNTMYQYAFIAENHPEEIIDWNYSDLCIANLDIEVGSENGFPEPKTASEPLTAITVKFSNDEKYYTFGCGVYESHREDVQYIFCKDEYTLIKEFLIIWQQKSPHAMTGWNIYGFDIPYLVNRISRISGEDEAKKLSPWGIINAREDTLYGRSFQIYELLGCVTLDYMRLFRKFAPNRSQESYRLDNIAQVEGVGQKISYDDYDGLYDLYKKNYQLFIEYNIRDVELVEKLNAKGRLIEMALTIAYDAKVNYDDIFAQVRMWDTIAHNYLFHKNIVVPPKFVSKKNEAYEGAYVKDPQIGLFKWVASFDLNSLYPHLMMQYNIAPDTIVEPRDYTPHMRDIISQGVNVEKLLHEKIDLSGLEGVTLTPNGQFFRKNKQGFLPEVLEKMYNDRTKYKDAMLDAKKKYEIATTPEAKKEYGALVSRYANLQLTKKECLNSAYGALGSEYFRFFDIRQAEGITLAGQLSIQWIERKLNEYLNKLLKTDNKDFVIAIDTDSVYLNLEPLVNSVFKDTSDANKVIAFLDKICEDKFQPYIDKSYQELADYVHAYDQKMKMKRENLADKAIWTAKKRYIMNVYNSEGVQYTEPQIKITGLEAIKSSTPTACRDKIKQALNIIMTGTEIQLHKMIENFRDDFKKMPIEDIAFPRSMNGLKEYSDTKLIWGKGTPIHVRGALVYNYMLDQLNISKQYQKIQDGEKIKFIYLREPNIFKTDIISFASKMPNEFRVEEFIDYETQFQKSFIDPLQIILNCIGWQAEKISSLDDFFG
jgi:DNA polymerase elongation subunit (family B)